jgi:hypothetical protein
MYGAPALFIDPKHIRKLVRELKQLVSIHPPVLSFGKLVPRKCALYLAINNGHWELDLTNKGNSSNILKEAVDTTDSFFSFFFSSREQQVLCKSIYHNNPALGRSNIQSVVLHQKSKKRCEPFSLHLIP